MKHFFTSLALFSGIVLTTPVFAQATAGGGASDAVTVVIQITMAKDSKADAAVAAMTDMRAMVKKQPGFMSSEFLQNVNPANSPSYVHVVRWASLKYWESVFTSPEFAKLNAAGSKQYTVTASAFKTAK